MHRGGPPRITIAPRPFLPGDQHGFDSPSRRGSVRSYRRSAGRPAGCADERQHARAPQGIKMPPLPDAPVRFETGEGQTIRVSVYARGFQNPWSMAWVSDDTMLVAERGGAIRVVRNGVVDPQPVPGAPRPRAQASRARTWPFTPTSSATISSTSATPSRLTRRRAGAPPALQAEPRPCSRVLHRLLLPQLRRLRLAPRGRALPDKAPGLVEGGRWRRRWPWRGSRRRWRWRGQSGTARRSPA